MPHDREKDHKLLVMDESLLSFESHTARAMYKYMDEWRNEKKIFLIDDLSPSAAPS